MIFAASATPCAAAPMRTRVCQMAMVLTPPLAACAGRGPKQAEGRTASVRAPYLVRVIADAVRNCDPVASRSLPVRPPAWDAAYPGFPVA
jgi:hypothetical protein